MDSAHVVCFIKKVTFILKTSEVELYSLVGRQFGFYMSSMSSVGWSSSGAGDSCAVLCQ